MTDTGVLFEKLVGLQLGSVNIKGSQNCSLTEGVEAAYVYVPRPWSLTFGSRVNHVLYFCSVRGIFINTYAVNYMAA